MKKELKLHIPFLVAFFLLISVYKTVNAPSFAGSWFDLDHLIFWLGGLIGILLIYIDHFVYAFFLNTSESVSQQAAGMANNKNYGKALEILLKGHSQKDRLIFHSALFQVVFIVFAFFVLTSTGSLLGRGIVLGMLSHLLVDMTQDLSTEKNIDGWFVTSPFSVGRDKQVWYVGIQAVGLVALALFF